MSKVVAINGSPRMEKGYTHMLLTPFLQGWEKHGQDCPYQEWAADVECLDKAGPGTTAGFGSFGIYEVVIVSVVCGLLCLVPLGVVLILLGVWLVRRRRAQPAESAHR